LSGDLLAQSVTQEAVMLRLLGHSITVETPTNAMLFATGNNLRIVGDLTRRCLVARLDPACEHPELRTFDRDALAYAAARRADIVWAALTIMKAYLVAGRPGTLPPLGSFETWSRLVREAIVWAGGQDPVQSLETGRASDPQRERLLAIMAAWWDAFGDREVTASEVINKASSDKGLRDALDTIKQDNQEVTAKRLGEWLARVSGQRIRNARFETANKQHGSALWRLAGYRGEDA
jgi:putative DNA primase/helicase